MTTYLNARLDGNNVSVLCGKSDLDNSVMPFQIDPVTGAILAELDIVTDSTSILSPARAQKDVNSVATLLGVADDSSGLLVPVIDRRNNLLYVDVLEI